MKWIVTGALIGWAAIVGLAWWLADQRIDLYLSQYRSVIRAAAARDATLIGGLAVLLVVAVIVAVVLRMQGWRLNFRVRAITARAAKPARPPLARRACFVALVLVVANGIGTIWLLVKSNRIPAKSKIVLTTPLDGDPRVAPAPATSPLRAIRIVPVEGDPFSPGYVEKAKANSVARVNAAPFVAPTVVDRRAKGTRLAG